MAVGTVGFGRFRIGANSGGLPARIFKFRPLYLMLVPCVVYYILFCYVPMGGIILAFKEYSFNRGIFGSAWVGFRYFRTFWESYDRGRLIFNTLVIGIIKTFLEFPFAIVLALMLNEVRSVRFKKLTQTVSYMPHFLSSVVVVTMIQRLLAPQTGTLNQLAAFFGGDPATFFLMEPKYFYGILFGMDLWVNVGWDSIVYLAAISTVDPSLYEAAEIDGCGKLRKTWHITLPGIRMTIGLLFIMRVGGLLSSGFEQIYLLRTPGNMAVADTLDLFVLRTGLMGGQFGYATAVSLLQSVIGLGMVISCNYLAKKFTEISLW